MHKSVCVKLYYVYRPYHNNSSLKTMVTIVNYFFACAMDGTAELVV